MEEQNENIDTKVSPGLALGIDFGNSKISAAVWNSKKKAPSIILFEEKYQFSSTLYFNSIIEKKEEGQNQDVNIDNNSFDVGVDLSIDKNTDYYIYDIKKILGQKWTEEIDSFLQSLKYKVITDNEYNILFNLEENYIRFEDLTRILIDKIKNKAESQFKDIVSSCTISVPHSFNNNQRMAIKNAALMSGLKNVFIINEPLSTGIYYAFKNKIQKTENILIVDFGSSKLDVNLLSINNKNYIKLRTSGGDASLGGDLFNKDLINDILNNYKYEGGGDINDPKKMILLENLVEKAKKELTFKEEAEININQFDDNKDLKYILKRNNFNELNKELYLKIYKIIFNVIKESGINQQEINHIILQGNAIRVVGLTDLLKEKFQGTNIITNFYDSIAYGNAIYTAKKLEILNNKLFANFKIYDITPISLGLRTEGDLMSVMLPRGSRVPIKAVKRFITTQDNQSNIKFEIYEGERKLVKDNRRIEKIILKNIPLLNKKQVKVEVTFEVDEEFILTVTCKELSNNIEKSCQVVINEDLTQKEIIDMIKNSKEFEAQDKHEKERIKAMLKLNDKIFEYSHLYEGNEDILRELEGYRNWLKHSEHAEKVDYENKLNELNEKMIQGKNNSNVKKQNGNVNTKIKIEKQ